MREGKSWVSVLGGSLPLRRRVCGFPLLTLGDQEGPKQVLSRIQILPPVRGKGLLLGGTQTRPGPLGGNDH